MATMPASDELPESARLATSFSSVTVEWLPLGPTTPALSAKVLCQWLAEYDRWFKDTTGVSQGRRLHVLYARALRVAGAGVLQRAAELDELIVACRTCGMSAGLSVAFSEALEHRRTLERLWAKLSGGLGLVLDEAAAAYPAQPCLDLVESAARATAVTLFGSVSLLEAWGVLDSLACNQAGLTLAPLAALPKANVAAVAEHWHLPCHTRMALFIDTRGDIYPCKGLMGERAFALGNVHEPFCATLLARNGVHPLPLRRLAERGPFFDGVPPQVRSLGRASVCDAHRHALGLAN